MDLGQVRIDLVKKTAKKIVKMHPDRFTEDFDINKKSLDDLVLIPSKKLRNTIAGYITHQIKIANKDRFLKRDM